MARDLTNPARPALPVGWPLMPVPDETGSMVWPDLDRSVRDTIRSLLITRPGERLLDRRLGAGIQEFVHHPNTLVTRRRMHDRIAETLVRYEPRIAIDAIEVEPEGAHGERVRITLRYRIRMTGQVAALGLSIGLEG